MCCDTEVSPPRAPVYMPEHFGLNRSTTAVDRPQHPQHQQQPQHPAPQQPHHQQMDYQQHSSPTVLSNIHQHTGHALVHALGQQALQMQNETGDGNPRWSQYHLWRQHMFINGKSTKELNGEDKKDDGELWCNIEAQAAFLGPNLWDKTLPYDTDFKEHSLQYVDLDEFLSENGITTGDGIQPGAGGPRVPPATPEVLGHDPPMQLTLTKRERSPSPSPCEPLSPATLNPCSPADSTMSMASSGREFDPRTRTFSDEELKPQPMVKKSRKQFVPDDLKDEKYWARRRKNNMAAKRSRDARRMKENQIALRAGFLEKENMGLRQELDRLKKENLLLRDKLSKYGGEV